MVITKLDVKKHVLVPKHTKLSAKEREEVLKKYNATVDDFPKIHKNDPALAGAEVKPGDMFKIERASPTAGSTVFYRVISNA